MGCSTCGSRGVLRELPHFQIGGAYGGVQDWCSSPWMRLGGCAAVTACDSCVYFSKIMGLEGLCPRDAAEDRSGYVRFTEIMEPYLRPRWSGVDRLDIYVDGFAGYLHDAGEDRISMTCWPGEMGLAETERAIRGRIDEGWLIPCLTLRHDHPSMEDFVWHWYIVNGYGEHSGRFMVKMVSYGEWRWMDLSVMWDTGHERKGGLVLYSMR